MSDITINNDKNQDKNQKTTPVTESSLESNSSSIYSSGVVLQIWLPYQRRILKNIKLLSSIFVRYLSSYRDLNILVLKVEIFKQLHYYLLFIIRVRSSLYKV